jgi:hypothetical protein
LETCATSVGGAAIWFRLTHIDAPHGLGHIGLEWFAETLPRAVGSALAREKQTLHELMEQAYLALCVTL